MTMIDLRKPPVLVLATNPWLSGELSKAARKVGVNVKKFWVFRNPPPWSRYREYKDGLSEKQKTVINLMIEANEEAKRRGIKTVAERIRFIREYFLENAPKRGLELRKLKLYRPVETRI